LMNLVMPDLKIHGNIDDQMVMEIPVRFQRKTKRKNITTPDGRNCFDMSNDNIDDALIKAIGRAHHWQEMLDKREVKSIQEIAEQENLSGTYTQKIIRLTDLAPDITSAILDGKQPQSLQINTLIKGKPLPLDWNEQRKYLGFL
jgi:hypothetical protein